MNAVKAKLISSRGASVLLALVFLLVCLTVGSIVLAAATASSGTLVSYEQDKQDYFAVAGVVDVLKTQFQGATITQSWRLATDAPECLSDQNEPCTHDLAWHTDVIDANLPDGDAEIFAATKDAPYISGVGWEQAGVWGKFIGGLVEAEAESIQDGNPAPAEKTITVQGDAEPISGLLDGVTVTASMDSNYDLTFTVKKGIYIMRLWLKAQAGEPEYRRSVTHDGTGATVGFTDINGVYHEIIGTGAGTTYTMSWTVHTRTIQWSQGQTTLGKK